MIQPQWRLATRLGLPGSILLAGCAIVLLAGCNQVRSGQSSRAGAPGLRGEDGQMARNVADPNAPFSVLAPHLATREPMLDVNGVAPCQPAQITLFESRAQASGPHHTLRLSLANSGEACRLGGFPSITLLGSGNQVLGNIRIRKVSAGSMTASLASPVQPASAQQDESSDVPSPQVLLSAKGEADFQLGWTSGPNCEQVSRIAVAAPGTTRSVLISRPLAVCEDQVLITAVSPSNPN